MSPHEPTLSHPAGADSSGVADVAGRSLWQDAGRRLLANRAATGAFIILLCIVGLAILGPVFSSHQFDDIHYDAIYQAPGSGSDFLFGTDPLGRDMFTRTMMGARISLMLGVLATFVSLLIGITWGATAGYLGGRVDNLMMRFVDVMYSLPFMFLVIILMVLFGRNIFLIFIALGAVEWLTMARIVRGQTMALKHREFVEAAVATGVPTATLIRRHVVPNLLGPVMVYVTLTIPSVILVESFLSFLGLGVQEPLTSWGVLIKEGADEMETASWLLFFPALFLATTLFCFNFIGDGLRDALDPRDR